MANKDYLIYVQSRDGLYMVDVDGKVIQVFSKPDWFQDKKNSGHK
jgi:hypothetical protein